MTFDDMRPFVAENHDGVVVSFRKNGAAQASLVSCGLFRDGVAFTTRGGAAKAANLKRDPRCTIVVSTSDRRRYVVVEGVAEILDQDSITADELRLALREAYTACSGREHPNWPEYDQAMIEQRRPVIVVKPRHVYGARV